jgi:hypothetical protein
MGEFRKFKQTKYKKLLNYFFIISLSINCIFIAPYVYSIYKIDNTEYYDSTATDQEIITSVVNASLTLNGSKMIKQEFHGLFPDVKMMFTSGIHSNTINNYYNAYNYAGLSQYALRFSDSKVRNYIIRKADSWIADNGNLNYRLEKVDQCPIGIMYLNLYTMTGMLKYKRIADYIFDFLKSKRQKDNLIPYNNNDTNFSDAVGMYVPFLMEYYNITKDSLAIEIAKANLIQYQQFGIDKDTHLPFHGYNIKTGIKVGSCNWGRGIGWYLLAISYCPQLNDSVLMKNVELLPYTQFPLSSSSFDSSTALMFELYKQSTNKSRTLNFDFIRTHIKTNGYVSDCSGDTYGLNDYSHSFGNSELCNGLLLLLYSKN